MGDLTLVTWAVPVDTPTLCARLEAYVETKAAIHTFQLCIQYAEAGQALVKLPAEMIANVAKFVQQARFADRIDEWECVDNCWNLRCGPSDHLSPSKYEKFRNDFNEKVKRFPSMDKEEDFWEALGHYVSESPGHEERVEGLLYELAGVRPSMHVSSFEICMRIFADDFGLEVYFDFLKDWPSYEATWKSPKRLIFAYIILPSELQSSIVSSLSSIILDHKIVQGLAVEQKKQFQVALQTLGLAPKVHEQQLHESWPTLDIYLSAKHEIPTNECLTRARSKKATKEEADALSSTEWPKLMVLGSGKCEAGPEDC